MNKPLSKKDALLLRAVEAGFQMFEADAFRHCLARFEQAIREEYEVAAWMDADGYLLPDKFKHTKELQNFSTKENPFSGYDTPLYQKKKDVNEQPV